MTDITIDLRIAAFAAFVEESGWEWEVRGADGDTDSADLTVTIPKEIARQFVAAAFDYEAAE